MADFATDFYKIEVKNPIGVTAYDFFRYYSNSYYLPGNWILVEFKDLGIQELKDVSPRPIDRSRRAETPWSRSGS